MEGSKLRLGRYSTAYRARLVAGGCQVQKFLDKKGIGLQSFLRCSDRVIDKLLEEFVTQNHRRQSSGRALRDTKHGILFVQISRPDLKHRLKSAWDTLKSWEESIPSQLRTPMPLPVMMAMLCYARVQGMEASNDIRMQNKWFQFSVLVSLGFFGLLRPVEMFQLLRKHVDLPNSLTFALPAATLTIERPKNHRQLGRSQFVTIHQPDVCNWLTWQCLGLQAEMPLWEYSPSEFRRMFKQVTVSLSIAECKYSPASLRAGGATYLYDEYNDIGKLRLAGRWANTQSLEHYVQLGKSQQLLQRMSARAQKKIKTLLQTGSFLLSLPHQKAIQLPKDQRLQCRRWDSNGQVLSIACRRWARLVEEDAQSGG